MADTTLRSLVPEAAPGWGIERAARTRKPRDDAARTRKATSSPSDIATLPMTRHRQGIVVIISGRVDFRQESTTAQEMFLVTAGDLVETITPEARARRPRSTTTDRFQGTQKNKLWSPGLTQTRPSCHEVRPQITLTNDGSPTRRSPLNRGAKRGCGRVTAWPAKPAIME